MTRSEQLEINIDCQPIDVGKKVKIMNTKNETLEQEDYLYLKKYENRMGIISEIHKSQTGIYAYRVDFTQKDFGYFYNKDFILINEGPENP